MEIRMESERVQMLHCENGQQYPLRILYTWVCHADEQK